MKCCTELLGAVQKRLRGLPESVPKLPRRVPDLSRESSGTVLEHPGPSSWLSLRPCWLQVGRLNHFRWPTSVLGMQSLPLGGPTWPVRSAPLGQVRPVGSNLAASWANLSASWVCLGSTWAPVEGMSDSFQTHTLCTFLRFPLDLLHVLCPSHLCSSNLTITAACAQHIESAVRSSHMAC